MLLYKNTSVIFFLQYYGEQEAREKMGITYSKINLDKFLTKVKDQNNCT